MTCPCPMRSIDFLSRNSKIDQLVQLVRFLCVGGFATALHYAVMFTLLHGAGWEPLNASALGFITSAIINFILNARITFRSDQSVLHTAPRFAIVCAMGLLLNHFVLAALLALDSQPFLAQIIATLTVLSWNFIVNALWTFKKKN